MGFEYSAQLRAALGRRHGPETSCSGRVHRWSELADKVSRIREIVTAHDGVVGVLLPSGFDAICTVACCFATRRAFVLLNPDQSCETLDAMVRAGNVGLVISDSGTSRRLSFAAPLYLTDTDELHASFRGLEPRPVDPELACLVFTSGTTGAPKGVRLTFEGLENYLEWKQDELLQLGPDDCVLQKTPLHFDVALWEILLPLATGSRLVTGSIHLFRDPEEMSRLVESHDVTVINLVPRVLRDFIRACMSARRAPSSLRMVLVGGEELPVELMHRFHAEMPGVDLVNLYGPSEATISCAFWKCDPRFRGDRVPIGRAVRNLDLRIAPLPSAENQGENVGELVVYGCQVADGYQNVGGEGRFTCSAEATRGHLGRSYRTGDIVRVNEDGLLVFVGRTDHQVKVNGVRVELEGIEHVIRNYPGVNDVVVRKETIHDSAMLVAYVEPTAEQDHSSHRPSESLESDLRQRLRQVLPAGHQPQVIVEVPCLPVNSVGKKDREFCAPVEHKALVGDLEAPTDDRQQRVLGLLRRLVDKRLGLSDHLFAFGVDSIRLHALLNKVHEELGFRVSLPDVYRSPSIADWNLRVASDCAIERSEVHTVEVTPQVGQVWFLGRLDEKNPAYNSQFLIQFDGALPLQEIKSALCRLYADTAVYHAHFVESEDGLRIRAHPPGNAPVQVVQLDAWDWSTVYSTIRRYAQGVTFSPEDGDTIRWLVFAKGTESRCIAQVEHHYVHDGWSIGLCVKRLKEFLEDSNERTLVRRRSPDYFDRCLEYKHLRSEAAYRSKVLRYAEAVQDYSLPCDLPAVSTKHHDATGELVHFCLTEEIYAGLENLASRLGVSLFAVCMTAFQLSVSQYARARRFCVGTAFANRPPEYADAIGMFVNSVALPLECDDGESVVSIVHRTANTIGEFTEYQDVPLVDVLREVQPDIEAGRNPLFQVMFAFHDSNVPEISFGGTSGQMIAVHNGSAKNELNVVCIPRRQQLRDSSGRTSRKPAFEVLWEQSSRLDPAAASQIRHRFLARLAEWSSRANSDLGVHRSHDPVTLQGPRVSVGSLLNELERYRSSESNAIVGGPGAPITYRSLWQMVDDAAAAMQRERLPAQSAVLLPASKTAAFVAHLLACLRLNLPVIVVDPELPERRRREIEAIAAPAVAVVFDKSQRARIERFPESKRLLPEEACYVVFTSGTTGAPPRCRRFEAKPRAGCSLASRALQRFASEAAGHPAAAFRRWFDSSAVVPCHWLDHDLGRCSPLCAADYRTGRFSCGDARESRAICLPGSPRRRF